LKKELIVRKVADYVAQLLRLKLSSIGSLFPENLTDDSVSHLVGECIVPYFFKYKHIQLDIPRGPYTTSSEWLAAHMEFLFHYIEMWRASDV
jgi:hypothetical protein